MAMAFLTSMSLRLAELQARIDSVLTRYSHTFLTIAILILSGTIYWVSRAPTPIGPPIQYLEARAIPAEVPQGGVLTIRTVVSKVRPCDVEVTVLITTRDGTVKVILPAQGQMYDTGPQVDRSIEYLLPPTLGPGDYLLELLHAYACQNDASYIVREQVPFRIRPAALPPT